MKNILDLVFYLLATLFAKKDWWFVSIYPLSRSLTIDLQQVWNLLSPLSTCLEKQQANDTVDTIPSERVIYSCFFFFEQKVIYSWCWWRHIGKSYLLPFAAKGVRAAYSAGPMRTVQVVFWARPISLRWLLRLSFPLSQRDPTSTECLKVFYFSFFCCFFSPRVRLFRAAVATDPPAFLDSSPAMAAEGWCLLRSYPDPTPFPSPPDPGSSNRYVFVSRFLSYLRRSIFFFSCTTDVVSMIRIAQLLGNLVASMGWMRSLLMGRVQTSRAWFFCWFYFVVYGA